MRCPGCGEESFQKKKLKTEGWQVVGEIEVCALCGAEWKKAADSKSANPASDAARSRLAALLGEDLPEKIELSGSADCKFCRNCRHFIVHPFKTVCALSDENTDPMGECSKFATRQDEN